jgi:hypothetical protein
MKHWTFIGILTIQNWLVSSFTAAFAADDDTPWI